MLHFSFEYDPTTSDSADKPSHLNDLAAIGYFRNKTSTVVCELPDHVTQQVFPKQIVFHKHVVDMFNDSGMLQCDVDLMLSEIICQCLREMFECRRQVCNDAVDPDKALQHFAVQSVVNSNNAPTYSIKDAFSPQVWTREHCVIRYEPTETDLDRWTITIAV